MIKQSKYYKNNFTDIIKSSSNNSATFLTAIFNTDYQKLLKTGNLKIFKLFLLYECIFS